MNEWRERERERGGEKERKLRIQSLEVYNILQLNILVISRDFS